MNYSLSQSLSRSAIIGNNSITTVFNITPPNETYTFTAIPIYFKINNLNGIPFTNLTV